MAGEGDVYEERDAYMNDEEDDDFIKVAVSEDTDFMEFPKEEDNTILFSTVQAQFPNATGLKYKGPSGAWRAIRAVDNVLAAPKGGWGSTVYCISATDSTRKPVKTTRESSNVKTTRESSNVETRRKRNAGVSAAAVDDDDESQSKRRKETKSAKDPLLRDLPVMGLPYKTTTEEMKEYFETNYGELDLCLIIKDHGTGKSRGFGFIRFKNIEHAKEAVKNQHHIDGKSVTVKIKEEKPMKLFIGRLPDGTTSDQLDEYFSKFGEVTDVYLPTPFRKFGFITYASTEDGRQVLREKHELNGSRLNVEERQNNRSGWTVNNEHSSRGGYNNYSNPRDMQQRGQQGNVLTPNVVDDLKTLLTHTQTLNGFKFNVTDRNDKFNTTDRNDRFNATNRNDRFNVTDRNDRFNETDRNDRFNATDRNDRFNVTDRNDRLNVTDRNDRFNVTDRNDGLNVTDRNDRFNVTDRNDRFNTTDRNDRLNATDRNDRFNVTDRNVNVIERNVQNMEKNRAVQEDADRNGSFQPNNEANSMVRDGYGNYTNYTAPLPQPHNGLDGQQQRTNNNNNNNNSLDSMAIMANSHLKNMLYQFLGNQQL